ncbi:hypothetical protein FQZ97_825750 [compost metagenome]
MRLPAQALDLDLFFHQGQQVGGFAPELAGFKSRGVEAQQRLDLVLQQLGVVLQDAHHLGLAGAERPGHTVAQHRHALVQRGQRRLELVRNVAQEAGLVGVELGEPQAQPLQLLADPPHIGRTGDVDRQVESVLAQTHDGFLQPLERPGQPDAETQRHHRGQGDGAQHLLCQLPAAFLDPVLQRVVAVADDGLDLLGNRCAVAVQLAEGAGHGTLAVERGVR